MREERGKADLLPFWWYVIALGVYSVHGFTGGLTRDSGLYVYAGQEVASGAAPYVEVMNRAGPLAHVLPGLGVLLARLVDSTGVDLADVYGVRAVYLAISAAAVPLTYAVARRAFGSRSAGSAAAAAMLSFTGFAVFATSGPQSKSPITTLLVAVLLLLLQRRWLWAGVVTGLATLTWQPVLFTAAGAALVAALVLRDDARTRTPWPARLLRLVAYGVGGLLTLAVCAAYFAVLGELDTFWDAFFLANLEYTDQSGVDGDWAGAWDLLVSGFGWTSWVLLGGMVLLLLAGFSSLVPRTRDIVDAEGRAATLTLLAGLVGGVFWSYGVFNGYADAFMLLPLAALGWGALVAGLRRVVPAAAPVVGLVVAWAVVVAAVTAYEMWATRNDDLERQRAAAEAVFDLLPADATALSSAGPQPLALTGVRSISRYQLYTNGMDDYIDDHVPGGLAGYARWVVGERPTVITTDDAAMTGWLWSEVRDHYEYVGRGVLCRYYVSDEVDAATRAEIRAALADAR